MKLPLLIFTAGSVLVAAFSVFNGKLFSGEDKTISARVLSDEVSELYRNCGVLTRKSAVSTESLRSLLAFAGQWLAYGDRSHVIVSG